MDVSLFKYLFLLFLRIVIVLHGLEAASFDECNTSRCGDNGPPIRFPFWLKSIQPESCGYKGFKLFCNKRNQTVLELKNSVKVLVKRIDYDSQRIRTYRLNSCLPRQLVSINLSADGVENTALLNCSPPERGIPYLVPCLSVGQHQVYAIPGNEISTYSYSLISCTKIGSLNADTDPFYYSFYPIYYGFDPLYSDSENYDRGAFYHPYSENYARGFYRPYSVNYDGGAFYHYPKNYVYGDPQKDIVLRWKSRYCSKCETQGKMCNIRNDNTTAKHQVECLNMTTGLVLGTTLPAVVLVIALYFVHTSHRRQEEDQVKIDSFLEDYKALRPARYTFADIKKITNQFKDKLGEGSYGTVFKGKLSSEVFVAVKVLNNFTGNGEEFINEVGTMGGIHHVNVVRLVGFCSDGIKQALVYEFLPNDSLEKFIFSKKQRRDFLGWEKLKDIALGIARGIEYLHQGCEQRILHFDIKPHNILLDLNFNPKIADFGLAKLCSKDQSIVSMTAARGTMGYIAPEVFSRNFGNVSYKSDVYSFGMVLLEMVGGRKNIDVTVQDTTQTYFPEWIYIRLCQGQDLGILIEEEEHAQIAKRLAIIGLWCIQWNPVDRPSIKTAVQMLERKGGDALVMPPNPFAPTIQSNRSSSSSSRPARVRNIELSVIPEAE